MLAYIRRIVELKKHQDKGASAVEYGLLVAAIAAIIVVIVFALGTVVKTSFSKTCNAINTAQNGGNNCPP